MSHSMAVAFDSDISAAPYQQQVPPLPASRRLVQLNCPDTVIVASISQHSRLEVFVHLGGAEYKCHIPQLCTCHA